MLKEICLDYITIVCKDVHVIYNDIESVKKMLKDITDFEEDHLHYISYLTKKEMLASIHPNVKSLYFHRIEGLNQPINSECLHVFIFGITDREDVLKIGHLVAEHYDGAVIKKAKMLDEKSNSTCFYFKAEHHDKKRYGKELFGINKNNTLHLMDNQDVL